MLALLTLSALAADAPEISRSVGVKGGVVVLWPRVLPATADPAVQVEAQKLQARLTAMAEAAAPAAPRDVRPTPERVCPRHEAQLTIQDMGPCADLLPATAALDPSVSDAIRTATGAAPPPAPAPTP